MSNDLVTLEAFLRERDVEYRMASGGRELVATCVFCGKPGHLYISTGTTQYQCKVCGEAGNLATLRQHFGNVDLNGDAGRRREVARSRPSPPNDLTALALRYHGALPPDARKYLEDRGLGQAIDVFKFGYVPNRKGQAWISIPYWDEGKVSQIRYRAVPGTPRDTSGDKYDGDAGIPVELYNRDALDGRHALAVEGEFKTALLSLELPALAVVGLPGSTFKEEWVTLFADTDRVYLGLDPGEQHGKAAHRIVNLLGTQRTYLVDWPEKPDDLVRVHGADPAYDCIVRAKPLDMPTPEREAGNRAARKMERPATITAAELMQKTLPEQRWVVPGLIGEGVSALVSRPKIGKSWLLLQTAIAVASGGRVAGIPVKQGAALYLALEDTERRLQDRIRRQMGGEPAPAALTLATTWPRMNAGCIEALDEWIAEHPDVAFIAIDTLAKIRPPRRPNGDKYAEDYAVIETVKALADRYRVAVMLAHHDRKLEAEDPLDRVSGTIGLTGALDTILLLRRARGQHEATLFVTGRDIDERDLTLRWDPVFGIWTMLGDTEDFRRSDERRQIINLLAARAPLKAKPIATALDRNENSTRWLLAEMVKAGEILSGKDGYTLPTLPTPPTPPTAPTPPTGPTKPESQGKVERVGDRDDRPHRRRRPLSPKGQGVPQGVGGVGPVGSAEMQPPKGAKGKATRSRDQMNGESSGRSPAPGDDGQLSFVLAMGKLLGYPRLEFDRGRAIAPGLESWRKFADRPPRRTWPSPSRCCSRWTSRAVRWAAIWRQIPIPISTGPMADHPVPPVEEVAAL